MRFCTQCGASLDPGAQSCWQCGFRQPDQATAPPQSMSATPPPPSSALPGAHVPSAVPGASGPILTPKIIAGIIAVVMVIATVLFFVLPGGFLPGGSHSTGGSTGTSSGPSGADPLQIPKGPSVSVTLEATRISPMTTTTPGCPQGLLSCSGLCRDVMTDEQNCGMCENRCTAYQICSNGRCNNVPGNTATMATTVPPAPLQSTSSGSPAAAAPLPTTAACAAGKTLCNGVCTDLQTSSGNCGSCNNRCTEGQKCQGGTCVLSYCLKPNTLCNGVCKNLNTDMSNCGSCGTICPSSVSHGTVSCQNGACRANCEKDYGNCDGTIANGCESYLRFDANNCGSCGLKCPSGYACDADTTGCHPRYYK